YLFNDTWTLPLADTLQWHNLSASSVLPPKRSSCASIYDPVRNRMVIFGGNSGGTLYHDVWALSMNSPPFNLPVWQQLLPAGLVPSPRSSSSAIYDSEGRRMIIGGGNTQTSIQTLEM